MKKLFAFDLVILGYLATITVIVAVCRPSGGWLYVGLHVIVATLIALVIYAETRYGGRFWTFARYWYVIPAVLVSFRELHYLIPQIHPFADRAFDHKLAEIDARWFGDVAGFFRSWAWPPLIDLLHLCYWSYFVLAIIPGAALYARGELGRLREFVSVVMTAFFLSYLGYFAVPAVGPHHITIPRPPEIDGWILGRPMHAILINLEGEMADAFPSGHALVSMVVVVMAWRHHRSTFWTVLFPAAGCVLATMALRYHYVTDVLASLGLLPVAIVGGMALHAWREPDKVT